MPGNQALGMRLISIGLLLVIAIAGCLGSDAPAPTDSSASGPTHDADDDRADPAGAADPSPGLTEAAAEATTPPLPDPPVMLQSGCASHYSFHTVPLAFAQEHMPEGFTPVRREDGATFAVKSWTCQTTTIDEESVTDTDAFLFYLAARAEATDESEAAGYGWVVLEIIAGNGIADFFSNLGFKTTAWAERSQEHATSPLAQAWLGTGASDAGTSYELQVAVQSSGADFAPTADSYLVRYFATDGKQVVGVLDIDVFADARTALGQSTLALDAPNSPFSERVVGEGQAMWWTDNAQSYRWTPQGP